jgi:hypothetical protein
MVDDLRTDAVIARQERENHNTCPKQPLSNLIIPVAKRNCVCPDTINEANGAENVVGLVALE